MDERELAIQLAQLLGEELADRIPDLNRVVLALEREPASEELHRELHRLIHVVKGASRSAGIVAIESACHELETMLAATEPGTAIPSETLAHAIAFIDQLAQERGKLGAPAEAAEPERDASVRVAAQDLDLMMSHSAAVLVARQGLTEPIQLLEDLQHDLSSRRALDAHQLAAVTRKLAAAHRTVAKAHRELDIASSHLDANVRSIRLRSIGDACQGLDRIVHDTAAAIGKEADLVVHGATVRVDRAQVEVLRDVLIQLVRNSVAHGIEKDRGTKPARGQIAIEAQISGEAVRLIVSDDGAGLDLDAIRASSAARGIRIDSVADAGGAIFAPGLSTASTVSELAGRGVGLDVAKQRIEAMHGSITVDSVRGQGTTFTIELPTTVATISALVCSLGETTYALPSATVERAVRVATADIRHAEGRALVQVGGTWLPLGSLAHVLGGAAVAIKRKPAIVLGQGGRRIVVVVDHIAGMFDLAVGSLDPRLGRVRHVTGQARLANGAVALVLNPSDVIEDVIGMTVEQPAPIAKPATRRRILVVDDSATTRALEANILRTAGYEVVTAVDGEAAMRALSDNLAVDLIVSDVDMPNLDGFGLAQAVRGIERLATLPLILVTARGTDEDRARGLRVGASAYLVKSSFDQTVLLQTIARLL